MAARYSLFAALPLAVALLARCGSSERESEGSAGVAAAQGGSAGTSSAGNAGSGSPRAGSGGGITVEAAGAGGDCEREVTFQAVVLGEPAPFDLIIVADHSDSLAWSRDELAAGLGELLTNVQGRSVRIFLFTPTQYGASSAPARNPLTGEPVVAWQDPTTGEGFAPAMTRYSETCTDAQGASIACPEPGIGAPFEVEGTWEFVMPDPIAVLSPEQTAAEFTAQQEAVAAAILALGGTGSPEEQPLCTLSRYVSQDPARLPENAVFLIISDEDDVSLPEACLVSWHGELAAYEVENGATPCDSDCDVYRYAVHGSYHWERHAFECQAYTDTGEPIAGTEMMSWYNLGALASCDDLDAGPCNDEEFAAIQPFCDSGLRVSKCTRECATREATCRVDLADADVNPCTESFSYNGATWDNLEEYCKGQGSDLGDCSGGGVNLEYDLRYSGAWSREALMPGETTEAVGSYFRNQAQARFGADGYLVEGIVFDPTFACPLGTGQSHATNISRVVGSPERLFPICETYAPALRGVLDFAQALIQTEFALALKEDEQVTAVVVIGSDRAERTLSPAAYRYDADAARLSIDKAAIQPGDADLRVEVTSECRPVVR